MNIGDKVEKYRGSYKALGTIIAVGITSKGDTRYMVEYDNPKGLLHIHSCSDIRLVDKDS